MSPALQAAARAAAPPELLGPGGARGGRRAARGVARRTSPGPWLAAQLRACAASLLRDAGDALWAGGSCHRLLLAAGQSLAAAGLAGPAVAWWRELAADSERLLGPAHPDTLVAAASWPTRCWPPGRQPRR